MEKIKNILLIALLAAVIYYMFSGERRVESREDVQRDTVVVTIYDTVKYVAPQAISTEITSVKISRLVKKRTESGELDFPAGECVPFGEKCVPFGEKCDSVEVEIPIERKVYGDSTYRAYVSGYMPSLDSLVITMPQQTIYIREKKKRWSVGVQAGYGVSMAGGVRLTPYIGIGLTYDLFSF